MMAMIGLIGCIAASTGAAWIIGVSAFIAVAGAATTTGLTIYNGQQQEASAQKARDQQSAFHIKQLRMQRADKARAKLLTEENLMRTRSAVMTSVSFSDLLAARANREGNRLRRENALNGAGVTSNVSTKPKGTYFYGNSN